MKRLFTRRYAPHVLMVPVLLLSAVLLAQVFDAGTADPVMNWGLYKRIKQHEVANLDELARDFEWQQLQLMPVAPPDAGFRWTQPSEPNPFPFDPKGFPKEFLAGLVPTVRDGVTVYPVVVREDPKTRERVFLSATGAVIQMLPPPLDYDSKWCLLDMYPDMSSRGWEVDYLQWLAQVYDPARLSIRYDLILEADLLQWVAVRSVRQAAAKSAAMSEQSLAGGGMAMMRSLLSSSNIVMEAITVETNGMKLQIGYPDDFTNRLEIYACTDLVIGGWAFAVTNLDTAGSNTIWWTDENTNLIARFYAAGNAQVDNDGDGLADAREIYLQIS